MIGCTCSSWLILLYLISYDVLSTRILFHIPQSKHLCGVCLDLHGKTYRALCLRQISYLLGADRLSRYLPYRVKLLNYTNQSLGRPWKQLLDCLKSAVPHPLSSDFPRNRKQSKFLRLVELNLSPGCRSLLMWHAFQHLCRRH